MVPPDEARPSDPVPPTVEPAASPAAAPAPGADPQVVAGIRVLLGVVVAFLLIAGMREAQAVVVPFLVAFFATTLAAPVVIRLERHGVPSVIAVALVVAALGGVGVLFGMVVMDSIDRFTVRLPVYTEQLNAKLAAIIPKDDSGAMVSWNDLLTQVDPGQAMGMVGTVLDSLRGVLTYMFLILLLVVFMLLDVSGTLERIRRVSGERQGPINYILSVSSVMKRYFAIKSVVSLVTGVAAGVFAYVMGVDFAFLWGLLAFLFNFIPNIGSILAAIPPVAMAFIQHGPRGALGVAAGYLVINVVMGNIVEPRVTGQGVGLSTLTVFVSLIFWGWVLGPVGMLLSVPLTMAIKLAFAANSGTRWVAVLMSGSD
jgi:predicted PurR-regulated permease PerM